MSDVLERFERKFTRRGPDECWPWTAATSHCGYGVFAWSEERQAHRAAYRLFVGDIPKGQVIRHRCDNPPCVNPRHLEPGTPLQNSGDAVARGRIARGSRHGVSKLTEEQALLILASTESATEVARRYDVHPDLVRMIQRGVRWGHLPAVNLPTRTQLRRQYGGRGEGHHGTHLTASDVVAIRSDTRTNRAIGEAFGVSATTVSNIKHFKQWGHIPAASTDHLSPRPVKLDSAPCSVSGCGGNAAKGARGLCRAHYHRLTRYGGPLGRP